MNIDDTVTILLNHLWRDHNKESCQHNQINFIRIQLCKKILIECIPALIVLRTDADRLDTMLLRTFQSIRILIVADDDFNLSIRDRLILNSVDDCLEIRSSAGYTYCDF